MELHVLFFLRTGEDVAEAMAVADEYTMDMNPDYMYDEVEKIKKFSDYKSHSVVVIDIPDKPVYDALNPKQVNIEGKIITE